MRHNLVVTCRQASADFLRQRWLGEEWYVTDDPVKAIDALQREPFDRLFLDHYLNREPKNGRDVSIWLGQHTEVNPRIEVFAMAEFEPNLPNHQQKAAEMAAESRRTTHQIPFSVIRALGE